MVDCTHFPEVFPINSNILQLNHHIKDEGTKPDSKQKPTAIFTAHAV